MRGAYTEDAARGRQSRASGRAAAPERSTARTRCPACAPCWCHPKRREIGRAQHRVAKWISWRQSQVSLGSGGGGGRRAGGGRRGRHASKHVTAPVRGLEGGNEEENRPAALAFHDDALDLVEAAVCAGRAMLDDIAADLAGSAALAGLGRAPLDGTVRALVEAGRGGRALLAGSSCCSRRVRRRGGRGRGHEGSRHGVQRGWQTALDDGDA